MSETTENTGKVEKNDNSQEALKYHSEGRPGKIEVISSKPCITSRELALAYTPGVAAPCLKIAADENEVFKYTAKGNLVGVISNGSAVLGLGNIGPMASKPVMEGKGILFKRFADIDVFDIEINEPTVEGMVRVIESLEPTFGGINLEDIKAPECFEVERQLVEKMNIPVFHDDQHGTAIIASAAFLNAIDLTKRKWDETKVVFSGAGAASIACARLFFSLGIKKENLLMCDSQGVIYKGRKDRMNKYKEEFAVDTPHRTLADAMKDADAFVGCSARGVLTKEMVATMAKDPIIFAMANPYPEIYPDEVAEVRDDAIMATGRTDFPNQVNNVLGFPFIFRGALDVKAKKINEEMKLAAVNALADLAREEVPDEVKKAYGDKEFTFGRDYLIPKPFDKRVLTRVSPAVAKAAMDTGVARENIYDFGVYAKELEARLGNAAAFIKSLRDRLDRKNKIDIAFAEGSNSKVLQAVKIILEEGVINPILIGSKNKIHKKMDALGLEELKEVQIIFPEEDERFEKYVQKFYELRQRRGISKPYARDLMEQGNYFAAMMVRQGDADGFITGAGHTYPECFKPMMRVIGTKNRFQGAGIIILVLKNRVLFLADCTAHINPNAEELSKIALATSELYYQFNQVQPKVAFLSFSNFGSNRHPEATKMARAAELTRTANPDIQVDGEIQADVAVDYDLMRDMFPFSKLTGNADVLIFPDLNSANICYKLISKLSDAEVLGPILVPLNHPANIVQRTSSVNQIVNSATVTAYMAKMNQ